MKGPRIIKELKLLTQEGVPNWNFHQIINTQYKISIQATYTAPSNSLWNGTIYQFQITIEQPFPFRKPQVTSLTPIFHPSFCRQNFDHTCRYWKVTTYLQNYLDTINTLFIAPQQVFKLGTCRNIPAYKLLKQDKKLFQLVVSQSVLLNSRMNQNQNQNQKDLWQHQVYSVFFNYVLRYSITKKVKNFEQKLDLCKKVEK